tara:strand:+ start:6627 stop:7235 length:609 start_codon:yes stop_codon:yes gene_type:complete
MDMEDETLEKFKSKFNLRTEHIDFDTFYVVHCYWEGKYTKGRVGYKGVTVWFKPSQSVKLFYSYDDNFDTDEYEQELLEVESDCGDVFMLRNGYIHEIIDGIRQAERSPYCDGNRHYGDQYIVCTREEIILQIDGCYCSILDDAKMYPEFLERTNDKTLFLASRDPRGDIWIIDNNVIELIIRELKEIYPICFLEDVTFGGT